MNLVKLYLKRFATKVNIVGIGYSGYDPTPLKVGLPVILVAEPDNPHDRNAIKVENLNGRKIGYISNAAQTCLKGCKRSRQIIDKVTHPLEGEIVSCIPTARIVVVEINI
jgi:hypothetical protein